MKAVVLHEYGGPEKLKFEDNVPEPQISGSTVLIAAAAASVNPIDWKLRSGMRQKDCPLSFPAILGRDVSGIVRAVGANVKHFKTGDRVLALSNATYAELVAVDEDPHVSPDGRWLAYESDESGRLEVYVVSFPAGTARLQISNSGGSSPRWSPDGKELFYISSDRKVMTAAINSGAQLEAGTPKLLFTAPDAYYDVMQNGQRFIFSNLVNDAEGSTVNVILNWTAGLKK